MTKSISRSQVRLIASTNAIFGADEACAMLCISRDAMYRLAPPALTVRVCYKVTGGPLSYLQVPGESPGYFFIHSIRSPHWPRSSASSSTRAGRGDKARYYLLTLVFHDQEDSIAEAVTDYEAKLARGDLPNIPFHSEPLMNGHKDLLHDSCVIVRCL